MKIERQGKINYLQPAWVENQPLFGGFTTRNGGVSRAPYNSLNLGFNTEDAPYSVEGNRSTLARTFDIQPHNLLTVRQVHGTDVLVIDAPNPDLSHFLTVESDAIVTNQPGIMIGILVADCFPVLLYDAEQKAIAAVHVGWRGAAAGIIGKAIKAMECHFGCRPQQIKAAVGPGIGAHSYEVDRPVRDAFRQGSGYWKEIAKEVELGKWQLDLKESCRLQLEGAGVLPGNLDFAEECTCCHKELFFSYRRENGKTGRQLGFMMMK